MDGSGIEPDADTWVLIYVKHVSKHSSSVVDPEREDLGGISGPDAGVTRLCT